MTWVSGTLYCRSAAAASVMNGKTRHSLVTLVLPRLKVGTIAKTAERVLIERAQFTHSAI